MGKDGKKGLGMGLGALFGEEYPTAQPEREETAPDLLPIEKIEPRADQPRKRSPSPSAPTGSSSRSRCGRSTAAFIRSSRASAAGAPAA